MNSTAATCKCHKCNSEYPSAMFMTCPFCYVAEVTEQDTRAALLERRDATMAQCDDCLHENPTCEGCPNDTLLREIMQEFVDLNIRTRKYRVIA